MCSMTPRPVRRRRVFYIPGYDPLPPRRYRELYRKEAALQAAISGYDIRLTSVSPSRGKYGWQVEATIDGQEVQTEVEVLIWSDLVRDSFEGSVFKTYAALLRTAYVYITSGALYRLMRLRKGPVIAALYPVVMLLGQLGIALLAGWLVFKWALHGIALWSGSAPSIGISLVVFAVAVSVVWAILRFFRLRDGRLFAHYLMHDFAYSSALLGAYPAALEERLREFRVRLAAALDTEVDEVLVVGHSSGAHLGISVLADLMRNQTSRGTASLAFLSLGHVVPMVSFLPRATRLRADLRLLSTSQDIAWVDVTAPGDGCCFALCDPVSVSGQATSQKLGPLVFSAAFTQSLTPKKWKELRWRFFRLHLQYLCAFDRPKDYDYFQITAGPLRLADRFAGRPASKSRLEASVTGYCSVSP